MSFFYLLDAHFFQQVFEILDHFLPVRKYLKSITQTSVLEIELDRLLAHILIIGDNYFPLRI